MRPVVPLPAVAAAAEPDAAGYVIINGRRVRMISTKGFSPTKKKAASSARSDQLVVTKTQPKKKTKMVKKELDFYRDLLLSERARLLGLVTGMEDEALRSKGGNLSNMPIHMADVGTDTFDQDLGTRHGRDGAQASQRDQRRTQANQGKELRCL